MSSRSRATVSPCSLTTDQPSRGRSETITSSGSTSTSAPSTSTTARPSAASAAASAAGVGGGDGGRDRVGCPCANRLPSARKLPFALWSTRSAPADESGSSAPTLSSSATSARSSSVQPVEGGDGDQRAAQRLPGADLGLGPRRAAELDERGAPARTAPASSVVDRAVDLRPGGQVHRLGQLVRVDRPDQVLPHPLGDERRQRRHQQRHDVQALVQRGQRGRVAVPEAPPRAADVPVGQVVDVRREQRADALGVEALERLGDLARRAGAPRTSAQRSSTGRSATARRGGVAGRPAGGAGVEDLEGDRVPVGQQHLADDLLDAWCARPGVPPTATREQAMNQRTASAPCSSISGIGSRMLPRCLDILRPSSARMWPRQTTFRYDDSVEDQRADRHQRVEPAAGLVDRLADEVGGVGLLETLASSPRRAGSPTARTASSRSRTRRR